jgi:hypothetical protein
MKKRARSLPSRLSKELYRLRKCEQQTEWGHCSLFNGGNEILLGTGVATAFKEAQPAKEAVPRLASYSFNVFC